MKKKLLIFIPLGLILVIAASGVLFVYNYLDSRAPNVSKYNIQVEQVDGYKAEVVKTDKEWRKILTPAQFKILRDKGTDLPFSNEEILNEKRPGTYVTADCNEPVFRSEQKFDSGTGWPSFYAPINDDAVVLREDNAYGIQRIEVIGKKCGGHLGHLFNDGPKPTGLRYCINATALKFIPDKTN